MGFKVNTDDLFNIDECAGTLISGTMRARDLIPAFMDALSETVEYEQLVSLPFAMPPEHALENEDDEWWESEAAGFFVEELFEILNYYAPDGYYFGAHVGGGSDYGFWVAEDF